MKPGVFPIGEVFDEVLEMITEASQSTNENQAKDEHIALKRSTVEQSDKNDSQDSVKGSHQRTSRRSYPTYCDPHK